MNKEGYEEQLYLKLLRLIDRLNLDAEEEFKHELRDRLFNSIIEILQQPTDRWNSIVSERKSEINTWIASSITQKIFKEDIRTIEDLPLLGQVTIKEYLNIFHREIDWSHQKPLEGYRVLHATHYDLGSRVSIFLANMGAEVITIDVPMGAEDTRWVRQYKPELGEGIDQYFITLNLKMSEGKEILYGLLKKSDLMVWNLQPGDFSGYDYHYDSAKEANPSMSQLWEREPIPPNRRSSGYNRYNILGHADNGYYCISRLFKDEEIEETFNHLFFQIYGISEKEELEAYLSPSRDPIRVRFSGRPFKEDNVEIYSRLLGLSSRKFEDLERRQII
ncbi:MAG: CoA transferase [bacterium]|nr:CoA transferase [bacterium]